MESAWLGVVNQDLAGTSISPGRGQLGAASKFTGRVSTIH
jgi:hypothetical protein